MSRTVGGWIVLVVVLGTGAWLELSAQGSEHVYYQETTYGMQSDPVQQAAGTTVAQASGTQR